MVCVFGGGVEVVCVLGGEEDIDPWISCHARTHNIYACLNTYSWRSGQPPLRCC